MAEEKTNVMRILDQKRVPYTPHHYAHPNGAVDGASVAALDRSSAASDVYKRQGPAWPPSLTGTPPRCARPW